MDAVMSEKAAAGVMDNSFNANSSSRRGHAEGKGANFIWKQLKATVFATY